MEKKPFLPSSEYPFTERLLAQQKKEKRVQRQGDAVILEDTVTVIKKRTLVGADGFYTKLFKNRELLKDLSPDACRIIVDIALDLDYESFTITLKYTDSNLERRRFSKALLELMMARIIANVKGKREKYWVNAAILVNGKVADIEKHNKDKQDDTNNPTRSSNGHDAKAQV